jgi:hypothetical protein
MIVPIMLFGGCAGSAPGLCRQQQQAMVVADLLFGRQAGPRVISEGEWRSFVRDEITPRFPDGVTVVDASGQWRDRIHGNVVREPSKVVTVIFRDDPSAREFLEDIAAAYKRRFRQQSVGTVIRSACVSF